MEDIHQIGCISQFRNWSWKVMHVVIFSHFLSKPIIIFQRAYWHTSGQELPITVIFFIKTKTNSDFDHYTHNFNGVG